MSEILPTQEVGSLAKPHWRVAIAANQPLTPRNFSNAIFEDVGYEDDLFDTTSSLLIGGRLEYELDGAYSDHTKNRARYLAARLATRLQEKAGLDIVYDGEQDRSEMYQHSIERTDGFEPRGRVRAFDNKSYKKFACVHEPGLTEPWHTAEFDRLRGLTDRQIKVPVTGAYTLGAWSYDEFYKGPGARRDLIWNLARNVIRPNIESLLEQGAEWIQIDEPAATTVPEEVPLFVESFNESVRGLLGKFSVHICFSDYSLLFPHVKKLENCDQFSLEFANRDSHSLGTDAAQRPAYEVLTDFARYAPQAEIGLGVTSVHDNEVESPELVRDRILRAVDIIGDPAKVYPSPDCGLRTRSWQVAYDKLRATVEGTELARQILS